MPTLTRSCNTEATIINPDYGGLGASFAGGELAASDNTRFSSGAVLNTLNEEYDYIGGNFDLSALPDGATINGITVTMERRRNGGTAVISDEHLRLSLNGSTFVGDDKGTGAPWSTSDEQVVYGGPTDLWGRAWTTAELKGASFGVFNAPKVTTAGTATAAEWDWLQISIRYGESGAGGGGGGGGGGNELLKGTIAQIEIEEMEKYIGDNLTFYAQFNDATLAATDATGSVAYRVYEEETGTPILTGTMSLLDDSNTTGLYSEQIAISTANGFEADKDYCIRIGATVSAIAQAGIRYFTVRASAADAIRTLINKRKYNVKTKVETVYADDGTTVLGTRTLTRTGTTNGDEITLSALT